MGFVRRAGGGGKTAVPCLKGTQLPTVEIVAPSGPRGGIGTDRIKERGEGRGEGGVLTRKEMKKVKMNHERQTIRMRTREGGKGEALFGVGTHGGRHRQKTATKLPLNKKKTTVAFIILA